MESMKQLMTREAQAKRAQIEANLQAIASLKAENKTLAAFAEDAEKIAGQYPNEDVPVEAPTEVQA